METALFRGSPSDSEAVAAQERGRRRTPSHRPTPLSLDASSTAFRGPVAQLLVWLLRHRSRHRLKMVYPARRTSDHRRVATRVAMHHSPEALRVWCWAAFGVLSVLSAFGLHMLNPIDHIISWQTSLQKGTVAHSFWDNTLDMLNVRIYLFNVTNAEEFLSGAEKLQVEEVGPFVYREVTRFTNLTLTDKTASFRAHRHPVFVPEKSIGDPKDFQVTVPNLALLGAAAMLSESTLVTNLALRSLALFVDAKLFLKMSAEDLFWGYDDAIISMAHTVAPSFIDFRRLGFIDRMYAPGTDDVVLNIGPNTGAKDDGKVIRGVYSVNSYNGVTGFSYWGHGQQPRKDPYTGAPLPAELPCDTVAGSYEGLLLPRKLVPGKTIYVYRKQFCRSIPLDHKETGVMDDGTDYFLYRMNMEGFLNPENPENLCYCATSAGIPGVCLPGGFSSVAPCFYHLPVALSMPHFMYINSSLTRRVAGMNPDPKIHDSFMMIQPEMGLPLELACRLQINLIIGRTRLGFTQPFNNMALPILWIDLDGKIPDTLTHLMWLALRVGPAFQATLLVALAAAGVGMMARAWVLRKRLAARLRGCAINQHIDALQ